MTRNETAVSEVVGYVIILGLVFAVFGLIFFNATALFSDTEKAERLENAERGFTVLQSNVEDVVFAESSRRTTQVRLSGGSVSLGDERTRTILKVGGDEVRNKTFSPVIYTLRDESVTYENGAVFRRSPSGTAMASEPGWVIRGDMVSIPGVRTFGGGSVGGSGTATLRTESVGDAFVERVPADTANTVNVTVVSENSFAWNRYMEDLNESDTTGTVENVTHTPDENRVRMDMTIDDVDQTFVYVERPIRVRLR